MVQWIRSFTQCEWNEATCMPEPNAIGNRLTELVEAMPEKPAWYDALLARPWADTMEAYLDFCAAMANSGDIPKEAAIFMVAAAIDPMAQERVKHWLDEMHEEMFDLCLLARRLVEARVPYIQINWSQYVEATQTVLKRVRLDGGDEQRLHPKATTAEFEAAFSSDDRYCAYVQSRGNLVLRLVIHDTLSDEEHTVEPRGGFSGFRHPSVSFMRWQRTRARDEPP